MRPMKTKWNYLPHVPQKREKKGLFYACVTPFVSLMCLLGGIVFQYVCFFPCLTAAEYGLVICDGVEMADVPTELQEARVFKLHLRNNGLHRFPDAKLQGTGNF